jgi:glycosyltransferase involved in cell wall biosynthesis
MSICRSFSIVITTFRRLQLLDDLLNQLTNQLGYVANCELIIVDNDMHESARSICERFAKNSPAIPIKYIVEKSSGPSYARNAGLSRSKYDYVIFLDDDVSVTKTFLNDLSESTYKYPDATLIGFKIIAKNGKEMVYSSKRRYLQKHLWIISESFFANKAKQLRLFDFLYSACLLANTKKLKNEEFDEKIFGRRYGKTLVFAEDFELCSRLILKSHQLIYDPSVRVEHKISSSRITFTNMCRRFLIAGIERRLMDRKLSVYKKYTRYTYNNSKYICLIKRIVKLPKKSYLLDLLSETLFDLGYSTYGIWIDKDASTHRI